jgi:hypothetical protein
VAGQLHWRKEPPSFLHLPLLQFHRNSLCRSHACVGNVHGWRVVYLPNCLPLLPWNFGVWSRVTGCAPLLLYGQKSHNLYLIDYEGESLRWRNIHYLIDIEQSTGSPFCRGFFGNIADYWKPGFEYKYRHWKFNANALEQLKKKSLSSTIIEENK